MTNLRIGLPPSNRRVTIYVNDQARDAYQGESIMAALIAHGYKMLRQSWKKNEPRGPLCGMGVCYECRVTVNGIPDQRACVTDVEEGMRVEFDEG